MKKPWELRKLVWPILGRELWAYQWLWDETGEAPGAAIDGEEEDEWLLRSNVEEKAFEDDEYQKQSGCGKEFFFQCQLIRGLS